VRFSQELSEDYQLVLVDRGAHTYVSTFDGHPYVAPFSGNIVELCPVGALTSRPYRFRARPWDIEDAGSVCTMCPAQCNTTLTVRDERAFRVLARMNTEVDDGWLCDKGRFAYQSFHVDERVVEPLLRDGGQLREVSWERALTEAATALRRAGAHSAAIAAAGTTNEEGHLLARLMRERLGSPHLDSRRAGALPLALHRALGAPALQARVSDLEFAHAVLVLDAEPLDDAPIFDLRLRKGIRRHGLQLALATPRRSALDERAALSLRFDLGAGAAFAGALAAALTGSEELAALAREAGVEAAAVRELARLLRGETGPPDHGASGREAPREVVVLWGERLTGGPEGARAARALLAIADALGLAGVEGGGLLEIPAFANGRGLREAGMLPNAAPGLGVPARLAAPGNGGAGEPSRSVGRDARRIAEGLAAGELSALYLLHCDPLRDLPDGELWSRALHGASSVIAHAAFLSEGIVEHADVVFPAEVYAEKEGTLVHPDGRLQRLRPAIAHPGEVRAEWRVLVELALRLGFDLEVLDPREASQQLFDAVPFYAGLTLEEISGRGVRWQEREAAAAFPAAGVEPERTAGALHGAVSAALDPEQAAQAAGYRSIWDAPEVEHSPSLEFLFPHRELV
jgi:NADH-quinone oxidoreductase subunit G